MDKILNKRGMALPMVLVFMVVLLLFGTALMKYSTADALQVAREEKSMQAHYLAKSGAESTADWIMKHPNNAINLINAPMSDPTNLGNGTFEVDVVSPNYPGPLIIKSTGYVDGIKEDVTLELPPLSATDIFDNAIYSYGDLDVTKMKVITGDLESAGTVYAPDDYEDNYNVDSDSYRDFPSPTFPDYLESDPDNGTDPTINGDVIIDSGDKDGYYYNSITIEKNNTLTFDTNGKTLKIVVNTLNSKGNIDVIGDGRLELYVKDYLELQTPITFNQSVGDPNDLIVYLADYCTFNIQANGVFSGFIYGPYANVELQSGLTEVNGAIVANLVIKQDNSTQSNASVKFLPVAEDLDVGESIVGYKKGYWN